MEIPRVASKQDARLGTDAIHTARTDSKIARQAILLAIVLVTYAPWDSCLCALVSRGIPFFFDRTNLTPNLSLPHSLSFTVN
ncbi:hypothetical protein E2C01_014715 [Portunus trituberculatus]|uniref:Uncharacterized protein n=1 Tax=Portunus trituberculatus TaxID=210409 RepID=A0A5B7DJJ7_PORTR|nr:hypothetical protein [Portunus trituberculatus]